MTYFVDVKNDAGHIIARDCYVHTDSVEAFDAKAEAAGLLDQPGVNIDRGIPVIDTPAVMDENGEVVTPATFEPGYFVNIRLAGAAMADTAWADEWIADGILITAPATPSRVWF